ncbi:GNAT family N-acetyltransferase [Amycolatopsis sulphurea]|uniref:GNAT family N-acetyltransferase n=1 Tax=Amycolatopsis sulphurea TaxID=76022 RepID=UPI001FE766B8|nr:GNAT family N-acetyltransferase [Amycolatopsis sulphurea]
MTGSKDFRADLSFLLLTPGRDRVQAFVLSAFHPADAEGTGVRELYVHYIGTRAEARRRGLASALLAYTLQEARKGRFRALRTERRRGERPRGAVAVRGAGSGSRRARIATCCR